MSNDTDNRVSELDAAVRERDALAAVIEEARALARPGQSVPLGVSLWMHFDSLLAATYRKLSEAPADVLAERDARIRAEVIDWVKAEPEGPVWRDFIERLEEHFGLTKGADRG